AVMEILCGLKSLPAEWGHPAQLIHNLPTVLREVRERRRDRKRGQSSLFAEAEGTSSAGVLPLTLPDVPRWSQTEELAYEKKYLGFYLSSHPLAQHEDLLRRFSMRSIADL